ncbi:MAG: hypothetical protein KUG82_11530 [Pseudomonadales bacterium]|nr:hypothetical protein [Pseudomonadales bacterium]
MREQRTTKFERFMETLLLAGRDGAHPLQLAMALQSNNISCYAHKLRSKGVSLKTTPHYSLVGLNDAEKVLDLLNEYRSKRGSHDLPSILTAGWD